MVKPIPDGWHTVTPRIIVRDPAALVQFVKQVFGAAGDYRRDGPSEIRIGDSTIMISGADIRETTTAFLYVYVDDVDATWQRAVEAGATPLEEPQDLPYGDRRGMVKDRWGNLWQIATHQKDWR